MVAGTRLTVVSWVPESLYEALEWCDQKAGRLAAVTSEMLWPDAMAAGAQITPSAAKPRCWLCRGTQGAQHIGASMSACTSA